MNLRIIARLDDRHTLDKLPDILRYICDTVTDLFVQDAIAVRSMFKQGFRRFTKFEEQRRKRVNLICIQSLIIAKDCLIVNDFVPSN